MSASKRKGTAFETAVVEWLRAHGFPYAERRALRGAKDCGDIAGIPGVVLEAKNAARIALSEWVDEAKTEAANAGVSVWAVVAKRRGRGDSSEAYAITNLACFAALLEGTEPRLGLATTRQLLEEIRARGEMAEYPDEGNMLAIGAASLLDQLPGSMLAYSTVGDGSGLQPEAAS